MNDRIKALYQTHILVNAKDETHLGKFEGATHVLEAYNPMCGDKFTLYLSVKGNQIEKVRFEGYGCAISKASTAVLAKQVEGKTLQEIKPIVDLFFELVDHDSDHLPEDLTDNQDLLAFAAAREFPERKTCATLSWTEVEKIV
ncbi:Fe-S cluster assembly sulfur transfer protein SufU [Roseivirga misakiensis]|uniref:SUF system NifU family Fe-S cluster assembly protein n=1 Tax=Roseivirga misakiensis TaxID=1563681 RepID=A0A1E5T011_9BACT|nr:SUF system NifU family Fe-S cluster assembly protein [Roseivirga misakiensis]OEK04696.1 SUF system NifU family Fe-S cluster assembly protein [Roseivirga misakiensis]